LVTLTFGCIEYLVVAYVSNRVYLFKINVTKGG